MVGDSCSVAHRLGFLDGFFDDADEVLDLLVMLEQGFGLVSSTLW